MSRGSQTFQDGLFSYISQDSRIPAAHPLRAVKALVQRVLAALDDDFTAMYASEGRPSIPPEQLLCALLLQALYGIRSERQLMEQMNYNLLFRWFTGLSADAPVWNPSTFSKNRDRMTSSDIFSRFMQALLTLQEVRPLLSDELFPSTAR